MAWARAFARIIHDRGVGHHLEQDQSGKRERERERWDGMFAALLYRMWIIWVYLLSQPRPDTSANPCWRLSLGFRERNRGFVLCLVSFARNVLADGTDIFG